MNNFGGVPLICGPSGCSPFGGGAVSVHLLAGALPATIGASPSVNQRNGCDIQANDQVTTETGRFGWGRNNPPARVLAGTRVLLPAKVVPFTPRDIAGHTLAPASSYSLVLRGANPRVFWRKLVAALAVGLAKMARTPRVAAAVIFGACHRLKMRGIDATRILAQMVEFQASRDRPNERRVKGAVGKPSALAAFVKSRIHEAISMDIFGSMPVPASVRRKAAQVLQMLKETQMSQSRHARMITDTSLVGKGGYPYLVAN